tara:strand:- start:144 stop:284 length:141 start_codon:yes stop_codon:yes gene_type:complete
MMVQGQAMQEMSDMGMAASSAGADSDEDYFDFDPLQMAGANSKMKR